MNKELVKELFKIFKSAGLNPRSYSGRAMFGKECLAVVPDFETSAADVIALFQEHLLSDVMRDPQEFDYKKAAEFVAMLRESRQDSMGLGIVIYWPHIEWTWEDDKLMREER